MGGHMAATQNVNVFSNAQHATTPMTRRVPIANINDNLYNSENIGKSTKYSKTYTLEKALLCGTKRASRAWNTKTRSEILSMRADVLNARATGAV